MTDEQIHKQAAFHLYFSPADGRDKEMEDFFRQIDSVDNLNYNPMAIRTAAMQGIRRAYFLGAKWAINKHLDT